jgi:hypothetical protein
MRGTSAAGKMKSERGIRLYANHLALTVRRRGSMLDLFERYGERTKIGTYRSWLAVRLAIEKYHHAELKKLNFRYSRKLAARPRAG